MISFIRRCGLVAVMAAAVAAGPVVYRNTDLITSRSTGLDLYSNIEERFIPSILLGTHSLVTSHVNQNLLNM